MPIQVPGINDTRDLFTITSYVNNVASEGIFFPIMLLVIWIISFVGAIAEGRQASRAWIFASFVGTVLGIMLGIMGFLDQMYIYFLILMVAFGLFWIKLANARND